MKNRTLLLITVCLTAAAAAARVLLLPQAAGDGVGLTHIHAPLLLILTVTAAAALALGYAKKGTQFVSPDRLAQKSTVLNGAAALFGLLLLETSAWQGYEWMVKGRVPAPNAAVVNGIDRVTLIATLLAGIVGGVFLLAWSLGRREGGRLAPAAAAVTGIVGALGGVTAALAAVWRWHENTAAALTASAGRSAVWSMLLGVAVGAALTVGFLRWLMHGEYATGWLWLIPVVWLFARIIRYDVSYAMAVDVSPSVYELLTYGLSALFLLAAAQYFSGAVRPSRWLRGLAAASAALTLAAVFSRLILWAMGETAAVAYCPLPNAADLGLGLFALALTAVIPADTASAESETTA